MAKAGGLGRAELTKGNLCVVEVIKHLQYFPNLNLHTAVKPEHNSFLNKLVLNVYLFLVKFTKTGLGYKDLLFSR